MEKLKSVEQLLVELQDKLHYETYPSDVETPIHKIEHLTGDYFPLHMVKTVAEAYAAQHAQEGMVNVERLIDLMNHQIAWANAEIKALPKHNDGTEEAYFKGHILGVNYCKKLLNQKYK